MLEDQLLGKRGVSCADLLGGVEQDAELDGRSGLDGQVGGERRGLAGTQIVGVDSQFAVMGGGDRLKLLVERLVFLRGGIGRAPVREELEVMDRVGRIPRTNMGKGYRENPGPKIGTLRQAQGRLWGTHCLERGVGVYFSFSKVSEAELMQ